MAVKCPNCGTTFQEAWTGELIKQKNLKGEYTLIPKEIHNDNVERINKENKTNTQKEEVKNMSNNMNMGNFDMDMLAKMVADKLMGNSSDLNTPHKVDLTKVNPSLKKIMVGLGWDVNSFDSGADFDLDVAAFMVGENGKCPTS